jgi:hypothetical protein
LNNKITIPNLYERLDFNFKNKPLLIGGLAMEYYSLRKAGKDVDFVLSLEDHEKLKEKYDKTGMKYIDKNNGQYYRETPEYVNLYGDKGILFNEFELWTCIIRFDYEYLSKDSIEDNYCKIISLEKLLFLKTLGIKISKYFNDVHLIVEKIFKNQYKESDVK